MKVLKTLKKRSTALRNLPINIKDEDIKLFEHELKKEIQSSDLIQLNNISITPDGLLHHGLKISPFSFPSSNYLVRQSIKSKISIYRKILISWVSKQKQCIETAYWVTDVCSHGYFHWITDVLPRVIMIQDELINDGTALLLPQSYQKYYYIKDSLKLFRIKKVHFINAHMLCKKLTLPTSTAPSGNYDITLINHLRHEYRNAYNTTSSTITYERIYISRNKASFRKIMNEAECKSILKKYSFHILFFEDYSFEEQVQIAKNTHYLVSNHGAGLTNMIFMEAGSRVLELRRIGDSNNNCYFSLASALQLDYFYQLCHLEDSTQNTHNSNLIVDCNIFENNLKLILSQ